MPDGFEVSAHEPISPETAPIDWAAMLRDLDDRTRAASRADADPQLPIAWVLHAWAGEALGSAAIRIAGNDEGLIGPAPARWRLLGQIEEPGFALAVLDGRAPLRPDNVIASLLVAPERPAIVSVRGRPADNPESPVDRDRSGIATPSVALAAIVDLALGRITRVSGSLTALPAPLRLAAALALSERGCSLATSGPSRRGSPRARAFVGTRGSGSLRRQLSAAEAALRKRGR